MHIANVLSHTANIFSPYQRLQVQIVIVILHTNMYVYIKQLQNVWKAFDVQKYEQ